PRQRLPRRRAPPARVALEPARSSSVRRQAVPQAVPPPRPRPGPPARSRRRGPGSVGAGGAMVPAVDWKLEPHPTLRGPRGPVVLVVLDGVGVGRGDEADAVRIASTPTLDRLWAPGCRRTLR